MEMDIRQEIEQANRKAVERIIASRPVLVDIKPAIKAIRGMTETTVLHAGPPTKWERMTDALQGAIIGGILYEGLADTPQKARKMVEREEITLGSNHDYGALGGGCGISTASMSGFVMQNKAPPENATWMTIGRAQVWKKTSEGTGWYTGTYDAGIPKALNYGCYDEEIFKKRRWEEEVLPPAFKAVIRQSGGIDMKHIIARSLHMGDEGHFKRVAGTLLLARDMMPSLLRSDLDRNTVQQFADYMVEDETYVGQLILPACKAMADAGQDIKNSSVVTTMCRNGTDFGIRVSGLGRRWFTGPAPMLTGIYFPGFGPEDATGDTGDSCITETIGIGAFAAAASPSIVQTIGGTVEDCVRYTKEMYEITVARNPNFTIPYLNFAGTPTGIDVTKVVETGITPVIDSYMQHKKAQVGMIGAGVTRGPLSCFKEAFEALGTELGL